MNGKVIIKVKITQTDEDDETLFMRFHQGDTRAFDELLTLYKPFINYWSRTYFGKGLTTKDLFQEGSIGLYKAVLRFDPNKGATFKSYAQTNIKSMMINACKKSNRLKHSILNQSISLYRRAGKYTERPLLEFVASSEPSPEENTLSMYELTERVQVFKSFIASLSELERGVLFRFAKGHSHRVIALEMDIKTKAVDNALTRIKRKIANLYPDKKTVDSY